MSPTPAIGSPDYYARMAASTPLPSQPSTPILMPAPNNMLSPSPSPSPSGFTWPNNNWYIPPSYIPPNTPIIMPANTLTPVPSILFPPTIPISTLPTQVNTPSPITAPLISTIPNPVTDTSATANPRTLGGGIGD